MTSWVNMMWGATETFVKGAKAAKQAYDGPEAPPKPEKSGQTKPPAKQDTMIQDAAADMHAEAARRRRLSRTVLTSGSGVSGRAPVARTTLLGG